MTVTITTAHDEEESQALSTESALTKAKGKIILDCLGQGLTLDDGLILADMTEDEFEELKKVNERFAKLVERKKIQYKKILTEPLVQAVKDGDSKLAQWLLERQFQEEFSAKRRPEAPAHDPVLNIINLIQAGSSLVPPSIRTMVKESSHTNTVPVDSLHLLRNKLEEEKEKETEEFFNQP